jgi:hypothetical protein
MERLEVFYTYTYEGSIVKGSRKREEMEIQCCRMAQAETGHQSFWEAHLLSKPAVTQWTLVQRLSPENKGGLPNVTFRTGYINRGSTACPIQSHM